MSSTSDQEGYQSIINDDLGFPSNTKVQIELKGGSFMTIYTLAPRIPVIPGQKPVPIGPERDLLCLSNIGTAQIAKKLDNTEGYECSCQLTPEVADLFKHLTKKTDAEHDIVIDSRYYFSFSDDTVGKHTDMIHFTRSLKLELPELPDINGKESIEYVFQPSKENIDGYKGFLANLESLLKSTKIVWKSFQIVFGEQVTLEAQQQTRNLIFLEGFDSKEICIQYADLSSDNEVSTAINKFTNKLGLYHCDFSLEFIKNLPKQFKSIKSLFIGPPKSGDDGNLRSIKELSHCTDGHNELEHLVVTDIRFESYNPKENSTRMKTVTMNGFLPDETLDKDMSKRFSTKIQNDDHSVTYK